MLSELVERARRKPWPLAAAGSGRVAAVSVSYGTRELTSQLLFSLCRVLARGALAEIVVVDNGSRDGSVETLRALDDAGVARLLANRRQRYHGPGIDQALSDLARRQRELQIEYVWVLDSDVVVLRPDVLTDAVAAIRAAGAAMAGQEERGREAAHGPLPLNSLLLDPAVVWRRGLPPFLHAGDPSERLQHALARAGHGLLPFPFRHGSYVLHLGRGSLRGLVDRAERDNALFAWASGHHEAHFGGHPLGPELHAAFLERYRAAVPDDDPATLARACLDPERVEVPGAVPLPPVEELLAMQRAGTLDAWVERARAAIRRAPRPNTSW